LPPPDEIEKKTVLIVDDDERLRTTLVRAFQRRGWDALAASSREEAIRLAEHCSPDLATVDLRMPGESGLAVVRELRALDSTTFILVLTGYGSIPTAMDAVRLGANHYMSKPADVDQILAAFESAGSIQPNSENDIPVPSLARVEWEHIQRVLNDFDGNISQAAKKLGLHRRSLQRKLAKYPPRI
jgi:two-component system response regulator RegA